MEIEYTKEQIEDLLVKFQTCESRIKLHNYFNRRSIFDILKIERKEIHHSSFIAWLFDDDDIGKHAVRLLLFLLLKRRRQFDAAYFPKQIGEALMSGQLHIIDIHADTEVSIETKKGEKGRVDIVITVTYANSDPDDFSKNTLKIVLENKVKSKEHSDQTTKYCEYYESKKSKEELLFVFLSLDCNDYLDGLHEVDCVCKKYIQISYRDLYTDILDPLRSLESIPIEKRNLINEYILSLTTNYKSKSTDIMVLTEDIKQLLRDFLSENNEIIKLAQSISDSELSSESENKGKKGGRSIDFNYYTISRSVSPDNKSNKHDYRIMKYSDDTYSLDHRVIKYGDGTVEKGEWEQIYEWNKGDKDYPEKLDVDILPAGNNRRKDYVIITYKSGVKKMIKYNENTENKQEVSEYNE